MTQLLLHVILLTSMFAATCIGRMVTKPPSDEFLMIEGVNIAVGRNHRCAIKETIGVEFGGHVVCWGEDNVGELDVPEFINFIQISAGDTFTCGITIDQTVLCWGSTYVPRTVSGLFLQVSAADNFACGVLVDGRIKCWGEPNEKAIFDGIPTDDSINFIQISCCGRYCCALDDYGLPHCFGSDDFKSIPMRKLGNDTVVIEEDYYVDDSAKDNVVKVDDEELDFEYMQFRQLSVSHKGVCGILLHDSNDLMCWGHERYKKHHIPFDQLTGPFKQISTGLLGMCAIYGDVEAAVEKRKLDGLDVVVDESIGIDGISRSNDEDDLLVPKNDKMICHGFAGIRLPPAQLYNKAFDQVSLGHSGICTVTMDSAVDCFGDVYANRIPVDLVVAQT